MQRYTISIPEVEHKAALDKLPYIHPETGESASSFAHLVRIALRSLPARKDEE